MRESTGIEKVMVGVVNSIVARSTEAGSRTLLAAAAAGDETHGKYMTDCHVARFVVPGRCPSNSS